MMFRLKIRPSVRLFVLFSAIALFLLPATGTCKTPPDLASTIQDFNHSESPQSQLKLSYQGLDLYAPIADKSSVDPQDRASLSKMKRQVIINAISKTGGNTLIAGIGSTGNWVAKRPGMIVNDYPAGNQDRIVQLKLKGCYMEGLSDLDFVVMGPGARDFQNKIYLTFAEGVDGIHLTPEEMDELEINFIADEQIKSLSAGPKGRKFWNQLMDLSNSSDHAEKYITKGGKALYGMAHLYEKGAVITINSKTPTMLFSDYAHRNGHKMGPFTLLHLFGGVCDMDYFIDHALKKRTQERVKTVLQVIKYLRRDEWMLKRAAKNISRLPKEITPPPKTTKVLENYAADVAKFTNTAIRQKVWASPQATDQFGKKARALSGLVCSSAHESLIDLGDNLLALRQRKKLTPTTTAILSSLVYDLVTVDKKRYREGYPKWYAPDSTEAQYRLIADKPQDATLEFLKRYHNGQEKDAESDDGLIVTIDDQRENYGMDIGPILPPPVASIEITKTSLSPTQPTAGSPITVTISGKVHGVTEEMPDFSINEYDSREMEQMKELAEWSLRATFYRMQIRYLMEQDVLNNHASASEKIYVSPYEIEALTEKLEVSEDEIGRISKQLNLNQDQGAKGDYDFHVRSTPSAQSIDDYLDALKDTCDQTKGFLTTTQDYAKQFYDLYVKDFPEANKQKNKKQLESITNRSKQGLDAVNKSLGLISGLLKKRKQLDKLADKDPATIAELAKEIEDKLEKASKETTLSLIKARKLNSDLESVTLRTNRLLTSLPGDAAKKKGVIKKGQALLEKWGKQQQEVNLKTIPALEQKSLWLKGSAWAAKSARWGFEAYAAYQVYKKNQKSLAKTDLGGGAEDAVLALTTAGQAIEKVISLIPIPVLKSSLNGYAKILTDSAKWAIAVDAAQARIYQDLGFNIRSVSPPAAYASILKRYGTSDSRLFFNRMRMPLAEYNGLIIIANPDQDKKWIVWNKHDVDGYTLLDKETHRKVSLYTAWYRRVYGKNISGKNLHALLTKGKIEKGYIFKEEMTIRKLKYRAERHLEYKALKAYLSSLTNKKTFSTNELFNYKAMLYRAAGEFAKQGFLLTDADVKETMAAVLYDAPIKGDWKTAFDIFTMTSGHADTINQAAKDWDRITGGEKQRLEAVLKKQIQAKVDRRTKAREDNWQRAKVGSDNEAIAAGLLYSQVALVFNHAFYSQQIEINADDFIDLNDESFSISWETTIPEEAKLSHAAYLGTVEVAGYPGTRIQIALQVNTDNSDKEEEENNDEMAVEGGSGLEGLEQQRDRAMQLANDICVDSSTISTSLDENNVTIATSQETFYTLEKSLQQTIKLAQNLDSVEKSLVEKHKIAEGLATNIGNDTELAGTRKETVCQAAEALKQCDSNTERDRLAAIAATAHADIKPAFTRARADSLELKGLDGEIKSVLEKLTTAQQTAMNNSEIPETLTSAKNTIKQNLTSAENLLLTAKETKSPDITTIVATAGELAKELKLKLSGDTDSQEKIDSILGQISSSQTKANGCIDVSTQQIESEKSKSEDFLNRYSKLEINVKRIKNVFGVDADGNQNPVFTSALEKANLADLLISMGEGYIRTCTEHLLLAKVCMNTVDRLKMVDYSFTMPNIVGMTCQEGQSTVASNQVSFQVVSAGKALHPDWEYCVDATDPAAGEDVPLKNRTVLISCFEELDIPAYLATIDCSSLPGGTAVYDYGQHVGVCDCVNGVVFNTSQTRCIDCEEYHQGMLGAFNAGDLDTAQAWVNESKNCAWVSVAQGQINEERHRRLCANITSNLVAACRSNNARAANGLLGEANSQQCYVDPQVTQWVINLVNAHNQRVREQQAQRNAQNRQNMQNLVNLVVQGINAASQPDKPSSSQGYGEDGFGIGYNSGSQSDSQNSSSPSSGTSNSSGDGCSKCPDSICLMGVCYGEQ